MIAKHLMSELKLRPPEEHNPAQDGVWGTTWRGQPCKTATLGQKKLRVNGTPKGF